MTLYRSLLNHSITSPEQRFVFPDEQIACSAAELINKADCLAGGLQALDLPHSSIVLLCSHNSSTLVSAFLAAQKAGLVPCVIAPAGNNLPAFTTRLIHHIAAAAPSAVFFDETHGPEQVEFLRRELASATANGRMCLDHFSHIPLDCGFRDVPEAPLAFVQFTSGSVLNPRAVMISHANVEANCSAMARTHNWTRADVCVCWLPLYHDMGLVGHLAPSCLVGWSLVLTDPSTFVRRPVSWLRLITEYHGTASAAPNFAYSLCANRIPDSHLGGIDLSTWRHAYNGSEPIRRRVVEAFAERFRPFGFSSSAIKNVYGLAETTLAATFPLIDDCFHYLTADAEHLSNFNQYRSAQPEKGGLDLVSVGRPLPGHDLRIVQPDATIECTDGQIGEIQLRGPSVMMGYLGGSSPIHAGWLQTGDMGFRWAGEIYITGRIKDVIKKGGKNIFAGDVEYLCTESALVRSVAAFEFQAESNPKLGIVLEMKPNTGDENAELVKRIRQEIRSVLEVSVDSVWVVPRHSIPKTTSGKIQRAKSAEMALSGVWGPPFAAASSTPEA
jgi:acyl-CoA synthetase (AMP-forming)/AMP-acid ligase II